VTVQDELSDRRFLANLASDLGRLGGMWTARGGSA
jgi:hypothetical protein